MEKFNIFLIESTKYLFPTMKIFIWIQWNVALKRNVQILSISNKNLLDRRF